MQDRNHSLQENNANASNIFTAHCEPEGRGNRTPYPPKGEVKG